VTNLPAAPDPLIYAVWVPGEGWLKVLDKTVVFADHRREVAEAAAAFIPGARVCVVDEEAMRKLESRFLDEEARARAAAVRPGLAERLRSSLRHWKAAFGPKR
jgi:hypothetical protein